MFHPECPKRLKQRLSNLIATFHGPLTLIIRLVVSLDSWLPSATAGFRALVQGRRLMCDTNGKAAWMQPHV
eukprot:scaffold14326_cov19-Tisochrysis_lutea.AAC.3